MSPMPDRAPGFYRVRFKILSPAGEMVRWRVVEYRVEDGVGFWVNDRVASAEIEIGFAVEIGPCVSTDATDGHDAH